VSPLTIWCCFLCVANHCISVCANHYIYVLQMVFQIITTSNLLN
jgi:hypothetical protein